MGESSQGRRTIYSILFHSCNTQLLFSYTNTNLYTRLRFSVRSHSCSPVLDPRLSGRCPSSSSSLHMAPKAKDLLRTLTSSWHRLLPPDDRNRQDSLPISAIQQRNSEITKHLQNKYINNNNVAPQSEDYLGSQTSPQ